MVLQHWLLTERDTLIVIETERNPDMKKVYLYICLILTTVWNVMNAGMAAYRMYNYWTTMGFVSSSIAQSQIRLMAVLSGATLAVNVVLMILSIIGIVVLTQMKRETDVEAE